jgi:hypothetical protein
MGRLAGALSAYAANPVSNASLRLSFCSASAMCAHGMQNIAILLSLYRLS